MQSEQKHPADELAKSLARAGGILTLLSGCYEPETGGYATGNSFVQESILAIEGILARANEALARLYQTCDLTVVRTVASEASTAEPAEQVDAPIVDATALPRKSPQTLGSGSYLSYFGPGDESANLSDKLDHLLVNPSPAARGAVLDRPAESYDELLQKLTAVADQAAFHSQGNMVDPALAPALEALRADFIKLRGAA